QPSEALKSHAFTLEAAEHWALDGSARLPADRFRLTSIWSLDMIVQHVPGERKTRYLNRLVQSESDIYGFAAEPALQDIGQYSGLRGTDHSLVGLDSRDVLKEGVFRTDVDRTALIDLV